MELKSDLIFTDTIYSEIIISKNLSKKDLKIEYSNLYTEILLRQKDGSLIEALRPNSNFFDQYDIESIKNTGIKFKPMVIKYHLTEDALYKISSFN
ncbi:hypothetical protein AMV086 [Betaentomopoxvirus amoorei]|uniref:AMV086 n=1 Tax=Amsacta moorei entomopoxvirus TaxID=28321 RepID=Q9EMW3_AMEPV|nr:hypothetical protein AMV086 [Amsacta moorei entomopoxvirus]AAG02792.1 AMV086 [Amsacta moorei entomopoxvirus]